MTGGTIAATTHYLRTLAVLDETTWTFKKGLANMHHARDGHGLISWRDRYLIVLGTWHHTENAKTAEMYDIRRNKWIKLPDLHEDTSAPGLTVMQDRYLYKIGGQTDIEKIERLDLKAALMGFRGAKKRAYSDIISS